MSAELDIPTWIVGYRVALAPDAPSRAINELGAMPGLLRKYFGQESHIDLLPMGRGRSATLFFEQFEPQRLEVVHEAALVLSSLTSHMSANTSPSLHVGSFLEFGRRSHDEALFADMPDYSDQLIPAQRQAC